MSAWQKKYPGMCVVLYGTKTAERIVYEFHPIKNVDADRLKGFANTAEQGVLLLNYVLPKGS